MYLEVVTGIVSNDRGGENGMRLPNRSEGALYMHIIMESS